jgi:hypothetical protein
MDHPNTLTAEKIQHLSVRALGLLAETVVFYIDTMDIVPDSGLYGDAWESLHVIALEIDRRHGAEAEGRERVAVLVPEPDAVEPF